MSFFHPVDGKNLRQKGVEIGEIPAGKCKGRKTVSLVVSLEALKRPHSSSRENER